MSNCVLLLLETWNAWIFFSTLGQTSTGRTALAGLWHLKSDLEQESNLSWKPTLFFSCFIFSQFRTPLHYAAANCNYQCLFALVGSGASVNDLDERGCTPLHYAAASDTDGKWVTPVFRHTAQASILPCWILCLQVPGIFTEKWCKSRNSGQSGLQCCALRFGIRTSSLSGAGEKCFPPLLSSSNEL